VAERPLERPVHLDDVSVHVDEHRVEDRIAERPEVNSGLGGGVRREAPGEAPQHVREAGGDDA
jgi:hypothetical protein